MTSKKNLKPFIQWLLFLLVFGLSFEARGQCAGSDGSTTICNKDTDANNKTFDLFPVLTGSPTPGGTWSTNDPANFFALNRNTGIVNLWEVTNSGVHQFTYTNDSCGESAIVTINLGGYPGEENIDGSADACGDDSAVNLHRYIGDETEGKFQDFNGTWAAITPEAIPHLNLNIFDAESAGPGIYEFTHTVPPVATCPSRQIRLLLEVQRPANSGIASNLVVCTTDDLSAFTNYDLDGLLFNEDTNGTWSEGPLTNELEDLTDHFIDVEAIRDTHTFGTFTFRYTVFPSHAVCAINTTAVDIVIQPVLRGTMAALNYCLNPTSYNVDITDYDTDLIASGTYTATYSLASASGTVTDTAPLTLLADGTGSFQLDANLIRVNEPTTLTLISLGSNVCPDIQVPPVPFVVSDPMVVASDGCEGTEIPVTLANIYDNTSDFANGSYNLTGTLRAPSGTNTAFNLNNVPFTSGNASFAIPEDRITETGDYEIRVEVASGFPLTCEITDTFTITPIPPAIDLNVLANNSCDATAVEVAVDAPILADGSYDITYEVIQDSNGQVVISNTINFIGGTASYDLEVTTLEQGNYTVHVRSTQNDTTPCRILFDFEEIESFSISGTPEPPVAEPQQEICLSTFAPDPPTLESIEVSSNGQVLFYATEMDMDILPLDTPLLDGEDYYISTIDPDNTCESSERVRVAVTFVNPEMPTASDLNPIFCASESPVVGSLNLVISNSASIVWFNTPSRGTPLDESETLIDGQTYYAATQTSGQCLSIDRLEIVPRVVSLQPASLEFTELAICGLDNPTVANLRELENDDSSEVLWYGGPEDENPLSDNVPLVQDMTYYARSFDSETGCLNPERIAVTVDLSNCNPDNYGFFIPDGFSPNNDGKNDTFYIPNIETIFPEYTLEILNRYGAQVFKGNRDNPSWDGNNVPNGVYFYIIEYNKEGFGPVQGRLYLNR